MYVSLGKSLAVRLRRLSILYDNAIPRKQLFRRIVIDNEIVVAVILGCGEHDERVTEPKPRSNA